MFLGTVLLFPNLRVYLQKAESVTEFCVLNSRELHTIRLSGSCGHFGCGFSS